MRTQRCQAHPQKSYRNVSNAYKHWYQFSDVYLACEFFVQIKSLKKLPSCWRHDPLPARAPLQIGSSWHLGHFQRSRFNAASRQGNDEWRHDTRIPTEDILLSKEKLQGWNEVTRHGCLCMISGFIECFYHWDVPTSRQKIRIPWKFHLNPPPDTLILSHHHVLRLKRNHLQDGPLTLLCMELYITPKKWPHKWVAGLGWEPRK